MRLPALTPLLLLPWAACRAAPPARGLEPPPGLDTPRAHLEPLDPKHAELDYAALMSSRPHLRSTLHWGDWPRDDFKLEQNRRDLERHAREFASREAFAYTVLAPDRARCLGCVYIDPSRDGASARLEFWVIEPDLATDLDEHLLRELLAWIGRDWPFERVEIPMHRENARGIGLARGLGLRESEDPRAPQRRTFVWLRVSSRE